LASLTVIPPHFGASAHPLMLVMSMSGPNGKDEILVEDALMTFGVWMVHSRDAKMDQRRKAPWTVGSTRSLI
jgi:hypothetical protein